MAEQREQDELSQIEREWDEFKLAYRKLGESIIDAAKLFNRELADQREAPQEEAIEKTERIGKFKTELKRWRNYLGFDEEKDPEEIDPTNFDLERRKKYDTALDGLEAQAHGGKKFSLNEETEFGTVCEFLDKLPLAVIQERALVFSESPQLRTYFKSRELPEMNEEERKAFEEKIAQYQEDTKKFYEQALAAQKKTPLEKETAPQEEKKEPIIIKIPYPEREAEATKVHITKEPPTIDGQVITEVALKKPKDAGPESAAILVKDPSKGPAGESFTGMNAGTLFNWENISSLQFVDSKGVKHRVSKENLSLEPPEKPEGKEELEAAMKKPEGAEREGVEEGEKGVPTPEKKGEEQSTPSEAEEAPPEEKGPYEETQYESVEREAEFVAAAINPFEAAARDWARREMETEKKELKGVKGVFLKILKHNWFREYNLEKNRQQALELMEKAGTPYAEAIIEQAREQATQKIKARGIKGVKGFWQKTLGQEKAIHQQTLEIIENWRETGRLAQFEEALKHEEALGATMQRFTQDHDKAIHAEAGEEVKLLDESEEKQKEIAEGIRGFIKRYVTGHFDGTLSEAALTEELNHYLATQVPKEHFGQAQIYATSLKETAGVVIAQLEHLQGTEKLQEELEATVTKIPIKIAKAAWGVRTGETEATWTEKIVRKIRETWVGGLVNEAGLATGVSLALSFSTRAAPSLARRAASMAAPVVGGAVVGGGFHAFQENMRLKEERITHLRERAQGLEFSPDAKRRAWMEQFVYQSRSATEATRELKGLLYQNPEAEKPTLKELNEPGLREVFAQLADLRARVSLSDKEQVDLISFSDIKNVEGERTNLDLTLAQAEVDLRSYLEGKTELKQVILQEQDFDTYLKHLTELASNAHLKGAATNLAELQTLVPEEKKAIRALDEKFQAERRKRAALEGLKAAAIGAAIGELTWETTHARDIFAEHPQVITPLSWALRKAGVIKEAAPTVREGVREVTGAVARTVTEELKLKVGPDGLYDLVDKAGNPIVGAENLQVNPDGSLTARSLEILKGYGAVLNQETLVDPTAPLVSQGSLRLSEGLKLVDPDGNGKFDVVVERTGKLFHSGLKDLEINPHTGEVSAQAQLALQKAGLNVARQTRRFVSGHEEETVLRPVREWLARHGNAESVLRRVYYDNDTKMFVDPETGKLLGADLNELRLWWGGSGTGLTKAGDYVFDVSHMTPDGSFHQGLAADAQALLAEGKLKLLLSAAKGTQDKAFLVDVNSDGRAVVSKGSELGKLLFENRSGRAVYKGFAAEVAQIMGKEKGVNQVGVLATHLGENSVPRITETVSQPVYGQTLTSTITSPGKLFRVTGEAVREVTEKIPVKLKEKTIAKLVEWVYQGPPVIPIIPRTPLEKAGEEVEPVSPYPEYPEYPEYAEYYPEYPEYGAEADEEYPYEEYEAYLPYYEEMYEVLEIPEEKKEALRQLPPAERVKEVAEKAKVILKEEKPYPEKVEELAAELGIKIEKIAEEAKVEKPADLRKEVEVKMNLPRHSREQTRKVFFTPDPLAGGDGHLIWQGICYGESSRKPDRELFRGYLQVDAADIPLATEIMHQLAKKRIEEENKSTELKWLIGTRDPASDISKYGDYLGNYERLEETEARVCIYAETRAGVLEILTALAKDPLWEAIEEKRRASPRRPGVSAYISISAYKDRLGVEWRSLNFNRDPGYSEDKAADPEWRTKVEGTPTVFLEAKEKRGLEEVDRVIEEVIQRPELRNKAKELAGQTFAQEVFADVSPEIINTVFEQTLRAIFNPQESGFNIAKAESPDGNEEFTFLLPQIRPLVGQIRGEETGEWKAADGLRREALTRAVCHLLAAEKGVNKDWLNLAEAEKIKYLQVLVASYNIVKQTLLS